MTDSKRPLLSDKRIESVAAERYAAVANGPISLTAATLDGIQRGAFKEGAEQTRDFYEAEVQRYERERAAVLARANNYEDSQGAMLSSLVVADELRAILTDTPTSKTKGTL